MIKQFFWNLVIIFGILGIVIGIMATMIFGIYFSFFLDGKFHSLAIDITFFVLYFSILSAALSVLIPKIGDL